ncbi:DUF3006 family protein [Virgibacillus halodenitrificans]|uniref:DUF3006 family protein n=1 Tax=Virgibacillus halodenitrificans TaxID=1482 RepID=A0ABR7VKQ1_VIRHA|nr:DUF3006 family protein [Virgibacillus halodenitrificans]MBD1221077.1 DUF3006 family protein [Virgibacillus halodenitrificans]MCG1030127.1 DUF3006 family protein [Virgibacillus halodenitrificans]MEC2158212.1 DUF3006 family protein [Virgibacillus halodenitrificans]MYL46486.1 DUF3006 family protein [Virgibacillus halodenitrificans]MYL61254.1 DUF3006 family protein [Virgibacillus halodenitrificans]
MKKYIVDNFVGDTVILLDQENERVTKEIDMGKLPLDVQQGDLVVEDDRNGVMNYRTLIGESEKAAEDTQDVAKHMHEE